MSKQLQMQKWQPQWHYDHVDSDNRETFIILRHDVFSPLLDDWDRKEWLGLYAPRSILLDWLGKNGA